jgi:deoxyribodipyrimidine photo-lyase
MPEINAIHWFRQDLRLSDNPALNRAIAAGKLLPLYILDTQNTGSKPLGSASRCWLHHSLEKLSHSLNNELNILSGDPMSILKNIISEYDIKIVTWNRCYEPWQIKRDKAIKSELQELGAEVKTFNGFLLWEPWTIKNKAGSHYKVFTPFYRKGCLQAEPPRQPVAKKPKIHYLATPMLNKSVDQLELISQDLWQSDIMQQWQVGEQAAQEKLLDYLENNIREYKQGRDLPAKPYISKLSPHLHFGEISIHQVWQAVKNLSQDDNTDCFLSELGWREFAYSLLYHYPTLAHKNLQSKFDRYPWKKANSQLRKWQRGLTGYPIVDAGMRELWQTGFMHNRVRMITASFLVKNLGIHWHHGERWFWDCLFDADLASNSAGWQWVAGCGADAAPFYRIFNPTTQAQKFDPDGKYIKKYLPELAKLPLKYLFTPWLTPTETLTIAKVKLGKTYPKPIIDLKASRENALRTYRQQNNQQ